MATSKQPAGKYLKWAIICWIATGGLVYVDNSDEIKGELSRITSEINTQKEKKTYTKKRSYTSKKVSSKTKAPVQKKINTLKGRTVYKEAVTYAKSNPAKAYKLFEQSCGLGHLPGCDYQAWFLESGKGVTKNPAAAKKLYGETCEKKSGYGCSRLGAFARAKKQYYTAFPYNMKGCNLKNKDACYALGLHYYYGQGVSKSRANAKKYFKKACSLKHKKACKYAK